MKRASAGIPVLAAFIVMTIGSYGFSQTPVPAAPNPDTFYKLGPDSLEQEGVPKGQMRGPFYIALGSFSGDSAHLLRLRPGAIQRRGPGKPHDFQ
jgi:hypothetical protein